MKKLVLFAITLVTSIAFVSCEKETILSIDQTSISIPDMGGSQTILLTANKIWTASSNQSWCKVSPSTGEEVSSSRIAITCEPNTTYDARNASVTFTCSEKTVTLNVSQATNNGLLVSQTSYELTKEAQQVNIEVKANVHFSVEVDGGCKDWVKYNSTKGLTTSTVVLDIAENTSYDGREGKVTIKQDGGSLSSTIIIKQSQLDGLFITSPGYRISNESHTLTVEVKSNIDFDVKPEVDWIKYVETKGLRTNQIVLDIAANDTYDLREGRVIVKQTNGNLSGTITILQDEKYGLFVSPEATSITKDSQTLDVEVKYNVEYDIVIPSSAQNWISINTAPKTKGLATTTVSFSVAENSSYMSRETEITFKQKNGYLSGTVKINQEQTDYLCTSPQKDSISYEGGCMEFAVITNVGYSLSLENSVDWVNLSDATTEGTDLGLTTFKYTLTIAENEEIVPRYASVNILSIDDVVIASFTIAQGPQPIIVFEDKTVKATCLGYFDINNDGEVSLKEASGVTSICSYFFGDNAPKVKSFNELQLFENVTRIDNQAFRECYSLKSIKFPRNLVSLGNGAMSQCSNLIQVIIPNSVESIDGYVFSECSSLSSITLPDGLNRIEDCLFFMCGKLTSIKLPESLEYIGFESFSGCEGLIEISIPDNVKTIYNDAFSCCYALNSVKLPAKLESIGRCAFHDCSKLESIVFPERLESIGPKAFLDCNNLTRVFSYNPDAPSISSDSFSGISSDATLFVPIGCLSNYQDWLPYFGGGIKEIK